MKQIDFEYNPKSYLKKVFIYFFTYSPSHTKSITKQGVLVILNNMIKNASTGGTP